jgi:hypothetical protein
LAEEKINKSIFFVYYVLAITGFIFRVSVWKQMRCQKGSFTAVMIAENNTSISVKVQNGRMSCC